MPQRKFRRGGGAQSGVAQEGLPGQVALELSLEGAIAIRAGEEISAQGGKGRQKPGNKAPLVTLLGVGNPSPRGSSHVYESAGAPQRNATDQ